MNKSQKYPVRYLLIARHGVREKAYTKNKSEHFLQNKGKGVDRIKEDYLVAQNLPGEPATLNYAGWLCDILHLYNIRVEGIISSELISSEQTANLYLSVFEKRKISENIKIELNNNLNPELFWRDSKVTNKIIDRIEICKNNSAVVIVGHQPQITGLQIKFLSGKMSYH